MSSKSPLKSRKIINAFILVADSSPRYRYKWISSSNWVSLIQRQCRDMISLEPSHLNSAFGRDAIYKEVDLLQNDFGIYKDFKWDAKKKEWFYIKTNNGDPKPMPMKGKKWWCDIVELQNPSRDSVSLVDYEALDRQMTARSTTDQANGEPTESTENPEDESKEADIEKSTSVLTKTYWEQPEALKLFGAADDEEDARAAIRRRMADLFRANESDDSYIPLVKGGDENDIALFPKGFAALVRQKALFVREALGFALHISGMK